MRGLDLVCMCGLIYRQVWLRCRQEWLRCRQVWLRCRQVWLRCGVFIAVARCGLGVGIDVGTCVA